MSAIDSLGEQRAPPLYPPCRTAMDGDHIRQSPAAMGTSSSNIPSPSKIRFHETPFVHDPSRTKIYTAPSYPVVKPHNNKSDFGRGHVKRAKPRRATEKTPLPNRIFVGGLTPHINEDDLRAIFGPFGELSTVYIKNRGGPTHRGFGFVTFKNRGVADVIVAEYTNGYSPERFTVRGHELKIQSAFMHRKIYDDWKEYHVPTTPYYFPIPPIIRPGPADSFSYAPYPTTEFVMPYLSYYNGLTMSMDDSYGDFGPTNFPNFSPPISTFQSEKRRYNYLENIEAGCSGLGNGSLDAADIESVNCSECHNSMDARPMRDQCTSPTNSVIRDQIFCDSCSCGNQTDHCEDDTMIDADLNAAVHVSEYGISKHTGRRNSPPRKSHISGGTEPLVFRPASL